MSRAAETAGLAARDPHLNQLTMLVPGPVGAARYRLAHALPLEFRVTGLVTELAEGTATIDLRVGPGADPAAVVVGAGHQARAELLDWPLAAEYPAGQSVVLAITAPSADAAGLAVHVNLERL